MTTVVHVQIPPYIRDCWVAEDSGSMRDRPKSPHRPPSMVHHLKFPPANVSFALERRKPNSSSQIVVCVGMRLYKMDLGGFGSQTCLGSTSHSSGAAIHLQDEDLHTLMFSGTILLNGPTTTRRNSFWRTRGGSFSCQVIEKTKVGTWVR
jgi:hypothetical protein